MIKRFHYNSWIEGAKKYCNPDEDLPKDFEEEKKNGTYEFSGYNYKNDTLIDLLNITDMEMKELETIIGKDEVKRRVNEYNKAKFKAKRRNEAGLTKREQAKMDKIKAIKELRDKGITQKLIGEKLKISINTVKKYISKHIK